LFLGEVGANVQFKSVRRLQAKFEIQRDSFELEQRTEKQNKSIFKTNPRNATSLCLSLVDIEVISGAIESLPIFAQYSSFRPSTFERMPDLRQKLIKLDAIYRNRKTELQRPNVIIAARNEQHCRKVAALCLDR